MPTLLSGWGLFCLLELARLISNKLTSSKFAQWVFFIQVSNHYIVVIILMNEDNDCISVYLPQLSFIRLIVL